jgi:hypothetical protein
MPLSWNLGTLTSWNPLGHSRPVTGLLYLHGEWLLKIFWFGSLYFLSVACVADGWEKFGILIFRPYDTCNRPTKNLRTRTRMATSLGQFRYGFTKRNTWLWCRKLNNYDGDCACVNGFLLDMLQMGICPHDAEGMNFWAGDFSYFCQK